LEQTLGMATIIQFHRVLRQKRARERQQKASRLHTKHTDWTVFTKKVKEKIAEVKTHDGWNRERDVKERYDNVIKIIKGKLAETTPKRNRNNLGNGGQGKIGNREKLPECVVERNVR
jgi:hypothetical protein